MLSRIILFGCGSPIIVDYIEVCRRLDIQIEATVSNHSAIDDVTAPIHLSDFQAHNYKAPFIAPLFTPSNRFVAVQQALDLGLTPVRILQATDANLPAQFRHGVGCFINRGVIMGSHSTIANYVCINRGACLGHHFQAEDFVSIGPGVVTGGNVALARGVLIGTGATILPEVRIGAHCIVGAGAVVTKSVPDRCLVVGNPAKIIKEFDPPF